MKRIICLLCVCILLSVYFSAFSTQENEYQYWHEYITSVIDREPDPSYNILELEEPFSTYSKMLYTVATISIDFTDHSLSLVGYRSDDELMSDDWSISVGDSWDGCVCTRCGAIKSINDNGHSWDGCTCTRCGKTRHEWELTESGYTEEWPEGVDPCTENLCFLEINEWHNYKCKRCGKTKTE